MRVAFIALFFVLVFGGCQTNTMWTPMTVSEASTAQDTVDAWNLHCNNASFWMVPPGFLQSQTQEETMGNMYFGSDYSTDVDKLMQSIQDEVDSVTSPDPPGIDLLIDVINHIDWYI